MWFKIWSTIIKTTPFRWCCSFRKTWFVSLTSQYSVQSSALPPVGMGVCGGGVRLSQPASVSVESSWPSHFQGDVPCLLSRRHSQLMQAPSLLAWLTCPHHVAAPCLLALSSVVSSPWDRDGCCGNTWFLSRLHCNEVEFMKATCQS